MNKLVRYERVTGILRFYPPGAGEMAPYVGAGTVVWRDACSFEIRGLKAELTRQHWRALVELADIDGDSPVTGFTDLPD